MNPMATPPWFNAAARALRPLGWQGAVGALCLLTAVLIMALPWRATQIETSLSSKALELRTERLKHGGRATGPSTLGAAASPGRAEERVPVPPEAVYEFLRSATEAGIAVQEARYDWSGPSNTQFGFLEVRFALKSDYSQLRHLMETLLSRDEDIALRRVAIRVAEHAGVSPAPLTSPQRPADGTLLDAELHWLIFVRAANREVSAVTGSTVPKR
jgi:hypothetical protein